MKVQINGGDHSGRKKQFDKILSMLEKLYSGAIAFDDFEMQIRLSRAIIMFKMDADKGFEHFAYETIHGYYPDVTDEDFGLVGVSIPGRVIIPLDDFLTRFTEMICEAYYGLSEEEMQTILYSRKEIL